MTDSSGTRPLPEVILTDLEVGLGVLLLACGGLVTLTFLWRWDGHVGAPIFFLAMGATGCGGALLLAGFALRRRWVARWLFQAPVIALIVAAVLALR